MKRAALFGLFLATAAFALNPGLGDAPSEITRGTPLQTFQGFLQEAHEGDYARAAHYLDLDHLKKQQQQPEGMRLARRLKFVLDRKLPVNLATVTNDPNGDPTQHGVDQLGLIPLGNTTVPIRLRRVDLPDGNWAWVFSEETVRAVDKLYDEYGPPFGETLPEVFFKGSLWAMEPWQWLGLLALLIVATFLSVIAERSLLALGRRMAKLTAFQWDDELVESGRGPLRLPFWGAAVAAGTRFLLLPPGAQHVFDFIVRSLIIIAVSWFLLRFLRRAAEQLSTRVSGESADQARVRGLQTQVGILHRIFEIAVYVISSALLLLQFEVVRNVGVSLLASAGIAGLVVGLAAQKSIGALLAGIQLSITQPIRIGDTVVIEGENGTIEEITLTYVVVRIWDMRRLVVPVSFFLDKPFQNWTRREADMLGTLTLEVDWRADIVAIRAEVKRLLDDEARSFWDGKTFGVQVTESKERTITVRVLVSAKNSGDNWDLRCLLRERLVEFIRRHPEWLPTSRTEPRATHT